jgi:putative transposase
VSTGQFAEALTALLGPQAPGLSATTVRRLTEAWQQEHEHWQQRDLSARRYVYVWAWPAPVGWSEANVSA